MRKGVGVCFGAEARAPYFWMREEELFMENTIFSKMHKYMQINQY